MASAGPGTLRFDGGWLAPLSFVVSVATWLAAMVLLIAEDLGRPLRRVRLRPRGRTAGEGTGPETDPEAEDPVRSPGGEVDIARTAPARGRLS